VGDTHPLYPRINPPNPLPTNAPPKSIRPTPRAGKLPRMKLIRPHTPDDRLQAFYARAVLWLCWLASVIVALGAPRRSRRLIRLVRYFEREVECIAFLTAVNRAGRDRRSYAKRAPHGFRRVRGTMRLFFKGAGVRLRGASLRARVLRLIEVLRDLEPYIARFVAKLRQGLRLFHLIATAPAAVAVLSAPTPAIAAADSS